MSTPSSVWKQSVIRLIEDHGQDVMSGKTTSEVCRPLIAAAIAEKTLAPTIVTVWSVDPRQERLFRVSSHFPTVPTAKVPGVIPIDGTLTGLTFSKRRTQIYLDLEKTHEGHRFGNPELVKEFQLKSLISVPIHNIGNPYQVILVLNFCFAYALPDFLIETSAPPGEAALKWEFEREVRHFLPLLASSIESNLRERSYRMATATSFAMGRIDHLTGEEVAKTFSDMVLRALDADYVSVFLENWDRTSIARGHAWSTDTIHVTPWAASVEPIPSKYHQRVSQVIETWEQNREWLSPMPSESELVDLLGFVPPNRVESVLLVPLQDIKGECRGVLRAVNFHRSKDAPLRRLHNYDDVTILEAMGRAFSPLLDRLLESDQRNTSLQTLAHELRVPVVALRAVHRRMEREYEANTEFRFRFPYFKEVGVYTEIMQRLMREIELIRIGPHAIELLKKPTNLWTEVAIPANRFIEPILRERGMNTMQIQISGFHQHTPRVEVDQALITQVLFNLLDNAIKYFPKNRPSQEFLCRVVCKESGRMLSIDVQDNGSGLSKTDYSELFRFGYRSSEAKSIDIRGSGIGLWLSRGIVERHGGELVLSHRSNPTIFTIRLPINATSPGSP